MYFTRISDLPNPPKTLKAAIKHSLKKWKKIQAFCEQKKFPANYDYSDHWGRTCALCYFTDHSTEVDESACPLFESFADFRECNCCKQWRRFAVTYTRLDNEVTTKGRAFKVMLTASSAIVARLERAKEEAK